MLHRLRGQRERPPRRGDGRAFEGARFFLPKSDNWWELEGTVGTPCGPDNEWFYPIDEEKEDPVFPDDYVEIGNDVYMQYRKTETGYVPLENKNVDTGFGLDRMLLFLNGLSDGYKTDLFLPVIEKLEEISGKKYDEDEEARKGAQGDAHHRRPHAHDGDAHRR